MKLIYALIIGCLTLFSQSPLSAEADAQEVTKEHGDGTVTYLSSNDFNNFISEGVVIVDFYADWCGPCKKLKPIFSELALSYRGKAKFAKVNIDHSRSIGSKYSVKKIPTVILFKDGKEIKRHGPGSKQDFVYWIDDVL